MRCLSIASLLGWFRRLILGKPPDPPVEVIEWELLDYGYLNYVVNWTESVDQQKVVHLAVPKLCRHKCRACSVLQLGDRGPSSTFG